MECGKERVGELVKENARLDLFTLIGKLTIFVSIISPEVLEKISNMLGMDDGDDSDEDVQG